MTNDCEIDGRYSQLHASSTDAAAGVKQLSALAAPGGKMLLNQEGFSNSPLSARQHKARGGQKVTVSSNGSHLFGCHGSTGEPWVGGCGGGGDFKTPHPAKKKEKKTKQKHHCRPNSRNVHHTRPLSQHTRHNKAVFTRSPACVHAALLALSVVGGWVGEGGKGAPIQRRKKRKRAGGCDGKNNHGHHGCAAS